VDSMLIEQKVKVFFFHRFLNSFFFVSLTLFFLKKGGRECIDFLRSFLVSIRKHPMMERSHIILCAERNTGHDAHFLSDITQVFTNTSKIEQESGDPGWWTSAQSKQMQLEAGDRALGFNQVRLLRDWATANDFTHEPADGRRKKLIKQFEEELKRYDRHELSANRSGGDPRTVISGRLTDDGHRLALVCDDLAFCFCFAIWLNQLVYRRLAPGVAYERIFDSSLFSGTIPTKRKR